MSNSHEQHAQIMGALDSLAKRLVKSELERKDLKEYVHNAVGESEDLRTLLEKSEISRMRQQESMLTMLEQALGEQEALKKRLEERGDNSSEELQEVKAAHERLKILIAKNQKEMKALRNKQRDQDTLGVKTEYVEDQMKRLHAAVQDVQQKAKQAEALNDNIASVQDAQTELRKALEESDVKQTRFAEELKQHKQKQTQMNRRIESTVQRYQRLERKFRRVEQIALESQEALQAKAMVLLTDKSRVALEKSNGASAEKIVPKFIEEQDNSFEFLKKNLKTAAAVALVLGITAGLGFGITQMAFDKDATKVDVAIEPTYIEKDIEIASSDVFENSVIEAPEKPAATQAKAQARQEVETARFVDGEYVFPKSIIADENLTGAMKKLERAAFEGNGEAQHDLAAIYAGGQGGKVEQDFERAAYWFHKSAENGVGNARYNLGVLFHQGLGVPQNIEEAVRWYQQAAQTGHAEAHYNLGIAYVEGIGMDFDAAAAAEHFEVAAREDIPEAAYNLGLILENGLLGEPNIEQALYWYEKGSKLGNEQASKAYDQLRDVAAQVEEEKSQAIEPQVEESEQHSSNAITTSTSETNETTAAYAPAPAEEEGADVQSLEDEIIVYDGPYDETWQDATDVEGTVENKAEQNIISEVQQYLAAINLYQDAPNGVLNNQTEDAIMGYQALYELPVTGKPSEDLLNHMRNYIVIPN